jgi:5-methylcytosine-specific restriction endonuclease McrA
MGTIYDGRPKVKHEFIAGVESKRCTKCDSWKSLNAFNKKKDMSDGLRNACRECQKLSSKKYRQDNHEKESLRSRENRKKYKDYHCQYNQRWEKENKGKRKVYTQNRRAKIKSLPNTLTHDEWEYIKQMFDHSCAYCGTGGDLEQDHFTPLTSDTQYGTSIHNILPACSFCNRSKWFKEFEEWYPMQEFYSLERHHAIKEHLKKVRSQEVTP